MIVNDRWSLYKEILRKNYYSDHLIKYAEWMMVYMATNNCNMNTFLYDIIRIETKKE